MGQRGSTVSFVGAFASSVRQVLAQTSAIPILGLILIACSGSDMNPDPRPAPSVVELAAPSVEPDVDLAPSDAASPVVIEPIPTDSELSADTRGSDASPPEAQSYPFNGPEPTRAAACPGCRVFRMAEIPAASRQYYRDVQVTVVNERSNLGPRLTNEVYFLLVRTDEGWFSREIGMHGVLSGGDRTVSISFFVNSLQVRGEEIVLSVGPGDGERVCGLDQAQRPVCF